MSAGTVVRDHVGKENDVEVRWRDTSGVERVTRFGVYDTDRFVTGRPFEVRYDPRRPGGQAFAADPGETAPQDDRTVPIGIVCAVTGALLLSWGYRGLFFAMCRRGRGREARAEVLESPYDGPPPLGRSIVWVRLRGPQGWPAPDLQRVMWHPVLEQWPGRVAPVTVRGPSDRRRTVVVTLADGTDLVPVGPRRWAPPNDFRLQRVEPTGPEPGPRAVLSSAWWRDRWGLFLIAGLGAFFGVAVVRSFLGGAALAVVALGWAVNGRVFGGLRP